MHSKEFDGNQGIHIKIESYPFYHINCDEAREKKFEKKVQNVRLKKMRFSKLPILKMFSQKFQEVVLSRIN